MRFSLAALSALACSASLQAPAITPGADIPPVVVDESSVTVSGISSGAYMAVQMHVAFSLTIKGAGVLAGGPFFCAQDDVVVALGPCMTSPELIDVEYLYGVLENTALWGYVDPLNGLAQSRVWLLSAQNDTVVYTGVVEATQQLYAKLLANPAAQMNAVYDQPGEHAQLTTSTGSPCTFLGTPYINECSYDAAGNMLQWLYSNSLTPPSASSAALSQSSSTGMHGLTCRYRSAPLPSQESRAYAHDTAFITLPVCEDMGITPAPSAPFTSTGKTLAAGYNPVLRGGSGTLYSFDQGLFVGGGSWSDTFGLSQTAYVYIPDACLASGANGTQPSNGCILHSAFHGCLQTQDDIGRAFMTEGGYLPWADANSIVVLFPQAISNLLNPKGCFDWWGYAGPEYASNIGTQTLAVKNMLEVLLQQPLTPNRTQLVGPVEAKRQWEATAMHALRVERERQRGEKKD